MFENFSILKAINYFAIIIAIIILFGNNAVDLTTAIKNNDIKGILENTGGKLLSLDISLNEETEYLLKEVNVLDNERDTRGIITHIVYGLSALFGYFIVFYFLFALFNWWGGQKSFEMSFDILILFFVIAMFFFLEFAYSNFVLEQQVYPLQGAYNFITNLPFILKELFL